MSSNVTSIGNYAFGECKKLTTITIPKSVTSISYCAFYNCSGLTSVVAEMKIPFAFGSSAFSGIASTCILTVPYGTKDAYIAAGWTESVFKGGIIEAPSPNITFADANVKSLCVANWDTDGDRELSEDEAAAVTDLGMVFKGNEDIVSFDELQYFTGVTSISNSAFSGCSHLTSVILPDGIETIGDYAFFSCKYLNSLTLPNSVTTIGDAAFYECTGMTSITLSNSMTSIGGAAFYNCTGLTSISIPNSVKTIGSDHYGNGAFDGCTGLTSIVIPSSVISIKSQGFTRCEKLESIVVEDGNMIYDSRNNCNAIVETSTNTIICGCKNTIIPNSVARIGSRAFLSCKGLTSITIPNSVKSIGIYAFRMCTGLTSITIPNSVTDIGSDAFSDCI